MVEEKDVYHFECEMQKDGTMVIRMFEYDAHIAISYAQESSDGIYMLKFPHSAVLYLQNNRTAPDSLSCQVAFRDGTTHKYEVPVIKVQTYSLEEVIELTEPILELEFEKIERLKKELIAEREKLEKQKAESQAEIDRLKAEFEKLKSRTV